MKLEDIPDGRRGPIVQPDKDGNYPEVDDWPYVQRLAVCATPGCPVEGIGFDIPVACSTTGLLNVVCARCSQPVNDLRRDLTPVGQEKMSEYKRNPRMFREVQREFNRSRSNAELEKQRLEREERIRKENEGSPIPIDKAPGGRL